MALESYIRMMSHQDLNRIHNASLEVLDQVGVEFLLEDALQIFKTHGATIDGSRVMLPGKLVEDAIESSPASFKLWGRDLKKTILVGEGQERTHVEPSNGAIYAQDLERGKRPGTLEDLINFYKLAQASPVCDIGGAFPVEPSDIDPENGYLDIFFEMLKHTDKPLKRGVNTFEEIKNIFHMLEIVMGKKDFLMDHPSIYASINPLSPLVYDAVPLETIIAYARYNQPSAVLSCALAGISAPMSPMGVCVMQNAEILAGLVLSQLTTPGAPFIYAPASAVPNMQNGQYVTGSPESNVINIANLQLAREFYHLPTRTMAGLTDAKVIDAQAGFETLQNLFGCMAGGASIINECLGVMDSIMTNSFEKFILDEEMISRILRFMEGMNRSKENLGVDVIKEIGLRGSFLTHTTTMAGCRDTWRPSISSWDNYDKWKESGSLDVAQKAGQKVKQILKTCPESTLDPGIEAELKDFINHKKFI
jgi:trimethylamine--corrinoid protein Co-methyltransferase